MDVQMVVWTARLKVQSWATQRVHIRVEMMVEIMDYMTVVSSVAMTVKMMGKW